MKEAEILELAVNGNAEARDFLYAWHTYLHLIDDIVDGDKPAAEIVTATRWASAIYGLPFYLQHRGTLFPIIQLITCEYEDANEMAAATEPWKRQAADVLRHSGANMVRIVAFLTGGYNAMRKVSPLLREACYFNHHTSDGTPI